jgi:hypothetical protein
MNEKYAEKPIPNPINTQTNPIFERLSVRLCRTAIIARLPRSIKVVSDHQNLKMTKRTQFKFRQLITRKGLIQKTRKQKQTQTNPFVENWTLLQKRTQFQNIKNIDIASKTQK